MGNTIVRVLDTNDYSEPQKDDMSIWCLKFMRRALQVVSRPGSQFEHDVEANRNLFLEDYPLQQIFERSLTADNIQLNMVALETLGQMFEGDNEVAMEILKKVETPWTLIIINFLKPYINTMGPEKKQTQK